MIDLSGRFLATGLLAAASLLALLAVDHRMGWGVFGATLPHTPYSHASAARQALNTALVNASPAQVGDQLTLARAAPLNPIPYVSRATQVSQGRVQPILDHVVALDPRNRSARLLRARTAIRQGAFSNAIRELVRLLELSSREDGEIYIAALGDLASFPGGIKALTPYLDRLERWRWSLVRGLSARVEDPSVLIDLYRAYPDTRSVFLSSLAGRGRLEEAFQAFLAFEGLGRDTLPTPFDGTFEDPDAPRPFNWRLNGEHADYEPGGGLSVVAFGRGTPRIADQFMALAPGRYQLAVALEGDVTDTGGTVEWTLKCQSGESNTVFLQQPVTQRDTRARVMKALFNVPPGACEFQRLELRGVAGRFPTTLRLMIPRVAITPAPAGVAER